MEDKLASDGVPTTIQKDGWWLESNPDPTAEDVGERAESRPAIALQKPLQAASILLFLVVLADWLFWQKHVGISIAIFATILSAAVLAHKPGGAKRAEWLLGMSFVLLCNLPVVEQLQLLSVLFSAIGIVGLVVWVAYGRIIALWDTARFFLQLSFAGLSLLPASVSDSVKRSQSKVHLGRQAVDLVLPLSLGFIFVVLLASANPILEQALGDLAPRTGPTSEQVWRVIFWLAVATAIWPYLHLYVDWLRPSVSETWQAETPKFTVTELAPFVTPNSVAKSLILFNALFAIQTLLDVWVLFGGVGLPESMTYAEYAHRGAYPLVVTALLAGIFAISTHRLTQNSRFVRTILYIWLGQTLFLIFTASFRLGHYVDAYTLTHLRVAAFIWMGLVFGGLALTFIQLIQARSVAWLVQSNVIMLMGTLYFCSFVNFDYVIADFNLNNAASHEHLDEMYICTLGEQALPLILDNNINGPVPLCSHGYYEMPAYHPINDWREWGFRRWRLQETLQGMCEDNLVYGWSYSYCR